MSKRLTYEDFDRFVRNRPQPDTPGFYKLWRLQCNAIGYERHEVKSLNMNNEEPIKGYMWRFPIKPFEEMEFEYYPNFEEAYASMMTRDRIDDCESNITFGYQISRLGFGSLSTRDYYVRYWMYDSDRKEYDRSSCSSYHWNQPGIYGKFLGRLPEEMHFKEGDIVEISTSRAEDKGKWYSTLGVVIGTPRSVKEIWNHLEDELNHHVASGNTIESYFDEPDHDGVDGEEYFILTGPYDEFERYTTFRHPIEVRPPSFLVPDEARDELLKYFKDYNTVSGKAVKI